MMLQLLHESQYKRSKAQTDFMDHLPWTTIKTSLQTRDNRAKVVRSPRLAATGVATLSGLIPNFLEQSTTHIISTPEIHHICT